MLTIMLIGLIIAGCLLATYSRKNGHIILVMVCLVMVITSSLFLWSFCRSTRVPDGYEPVYPQANFATPYEKDGKYYKVNLTRACWLPFAQCQMVELDWPAEGE